ncbi:MAG: hypothetical protein A2Y33_12280 [Spirochaetes bacterium GWF1_51_8]|nr:MAG: hypothetical protein A2Y33_12280 [Spirochaetes bacterium GWF1_51_8]
MRFICPEIEARPVPELILQLYETRDYPEVSLSDIDGNTLTRLIQSRIYDGSALKDQRYYYGRSKLAGYFTSFPLNTDARTIAGLASATGMDIGTNFTDTASYSFRFRSFLEEPVFGTSLWYTVFTDGGLYFALPLRRADARNLAQFSIVSDFKKETFFDSPAYSGETGGRFTVNADYGHVIPSAVDSTQKARVLNKAMSKNRVARVRSGQENVRPGDIFVHDAAVFVILSKCSLGTGQFEYTGVKESSLSWTFAGANESPVAPVCAPLGLAIPSGAVIPYGGASAPAGFLLCDGASYLRSAYPGLFAVIGTSFGAADGTHFNVPDLRGMFLRGRDGGAGVDPNRTTRTALKTGGAAGDNVGSYQTDAFQGHYHKEMNSYNGGATIRIGFKSDGGGDADNISTNSTRQPIADGTNGTPRVSSESRPKNVSINYIIRT